MTVLKICKDTYFKKWILSTPTFCLGEMLRSRYLPILVIFLVGSLCYCIFEASTLIKTKLISLFKKFKPQI